MGTQDEAQAEAQAQVQAEVVWSNQYTRASTNVSPSASHNNAKANLASKLFVNVVSIKANTLQSTNLSAPNTASKHECKLNQKRP